MTQLGVNKSDLFLTLIVYYISLDEAIYVYRRNILENNNKKIEKKKLEKSHRHIFSYIPPKI